VVLERVKERWPSRSSSYLGYINVSDHLDSGAPIAGPSRSRGWDLNPAPEGYGEQSGYYEG